MEPSISEDEQKLISRESSEDEIPNIDLQHQLESLRASNSRLKQCIAGLSVVLALFIVGLAIPLSNDCKETANEAHILSPVPSMPASDVKFEQDDRFAGPSSPDNDRAWGSLMPDGDGFILVDNPREYGLPPGKHDDAGGEIYDISLFHQLHCLTGIRKHLYLLSGSIGRNNSAEIHEILLDPQVPHIYHCFDYIRQALMCAGDMTVEWPREEKDGRRFAFDGWGVTHQCKDWDAIMKFMNENSVANALRR